MQNRSNFLKEVKSNKKLQIGLIYISILILWIVVGFLTSSESGVLVFLLTLLMSVVSGVASFILPNERDKILKQFKVATAGYLLWILMMFIILQVVANEGVTMTIVINMYYITMIMTPVGYVCLTAKKVVDLRGIGKTKRETIDYYKKHGNDGLM